MRALVVVALLAGCYAPSIPDGTYTCSVDSDCPDGQRCDPCMMKCVAQPATSCPLPQPCTNGDKMRVAGDPGNATVAFCPAAWTVPGASSAPACNNAPGPDGTANGTQCSIADNCAAGWHVCVESSLVAAKVAKGQCNATALGGFFATRQQGALGKNGVACADTGTHDSVLGCGTFGGTAVACTVLTRVIYSTTIASNCPNGWDCGTIGTKGTAPTYDALTKPSVSSPGGVICCKN